MRSLLHVLLAVWSASGLPIHVKIDDFDERQATYVGQGQDPAPFVLSGLKWKTRELTWKWVNPQGLKKVNAETAKAHIRSALQKFEAVTPLRFHEISSVEDAHLVMYMGSKDHGPHCPDFEGRYGGALAHAYFPPPSGTDLTGTSGDVHFNADKEWTFDEVARAFKAIDFQTVAIHEIGHSLGLYHSSDKNALMYFAYTGPRRYLAPDDVKGLQKIYGPPESPPTLPTTRPPSTTTPAPNPRPKPTKTPTPGPKPKTSIKAFDLGWLTSKTFAHLRYFSPPGTMKGWAAAAEECRKVGGKLLQLKNKRKRDTFMNVVRSSAFQSAVECGRDDKYKTCRPWIGGRVVADGRGWAYPAWVDGPQDPGSHPIKGSWYRPPFMDDVWLKGNGLHMVLKTPNIYIHDATEAWVRASFICQFGG